MRKLSIILFSIAAVLFTSCENEMKLPPLTGEDGIYMNARLESQHTSHSVYISYKQAGKIDLANIEDTKLQVNVNGKEVEVTSPTKDHFSHALAFSFNYSFKEGDVVELKASTNGKEASSIVTFPSKVKGGIKAHRQENEQGVNAYELITIEFTDDSSKEDFYRVAATFSYTHLNINRETGEKESFPNVINSYIYTSDPIINGTQDSRNNILKEIISAFSPGNISLVFNDEKFSGQNTKISFNELSAEHSPYIDYSCRVDYTDRKLHVHLQSLSLEDYNYFRAYNAGINSGFSGNILVEPTVIPSNVTGGKGYVAAITATTDIIDFPDLEDVYKNLEEN